ncbi:FecR domain-containing protein [Sphingomonas sp. Tas61C01]|uniref:FecR domain-containing protein n=1 Tax=Sphingomonas sp. Tas61C01 TaxID=3458297 RepID=UPI00403E4857
MPKIVAGFCAALLFATTSNAAMAQSLTWRISEAAGAVSVRRGAELRPAVRDAVLAPGDAVVTGAGGRAVLVHDRDFVTVSANSRVTVPAVQEASGFTQIIQNIGNAIFRIEKLKTPHFGVKTPYLAAVVKGTTFSVTVDGTGTSLQVVEGAVEVATLDGGAKDLIRPGAVATIGAGDLFRLQVQGDSARTIDSPGRPADAPAAATPAAAPLSSQATPTPVQSADAVAVDAGRQTIGEAISSKPVDLASITGGMMTGTTAAAPAMLVAAVKLETAAPTPAAPAAQPMPAPVTVAGAQPAAPTVQSTPTPAAVAEAPPAALPVVVADAPVIGSPAKNDPVATTPTSDVPKPDAAVSQPAKDTAPTVVKDKADDAKTAADDLAKAQDRAAKDAEKAAKDAEKATKDAEKDGGKADNAGKDSDKEADKAAKDSDKDADKAAKDADKAAKDAAKNADDAAKQAAKDADDAKKAADDAAKQAAKDADDAKKAADDAAKDAAKVLEDAAKAAAKATQDAIDVAAELAKAALDKLLPPLPGGH